MAQVVPTHVHGSLHTLRLESLIRDSLACQASVEAPGAVACGAIGWGAASSITRYLSWASLIHRHVVRLRVPFRGMAGTKTTRVRVGLAAEMLGVSVDTLRRWEADGRIRMERSGGGQRMIEVEEISRILGERRREASDRPIVAQSARNRFPGIVTRIERDRVAAVVEIIAGPHRLVSLMTAEAVDDMGLAVGDEAIGIVKATNVIVEVPMSREPRS